MTLALAGIKVLDVSQGIPGPLCAMVLADLGAEVLKIEPPGGDWMRQVGPFTEGESALFVRLNRGKKGVCLNLKHSQGKEALRSLALRVDVVIEGYRAGALDKLGLGYDTLAENNPGLVYCSVTGYGSKGPMAELPASELEMQNLIGQFRRLGSPGEPPLRVGFDLVSVNAGWSACEAIIAALYAREETGKGQKVETSLLDAAVALMQFSFAAETNPDEWRGWPLTGYTEPPAYGFQCSDASFLLDLGRAQEWWEVFCQAIGAEHTLQDPRFSAYEHRRRHEQELIEELKPFLASWTFDELRQLVQGMGGTIVRMHNAETLFNDPQAAALGVLKELEHPRIGKYQTINIPWRFSEPIATLSALPAPALGEHNEETLKDLGYDDQQVAELRRVGVMATS